MVDMIIGFYETDELKRARTLFTLVHPVKPALDYVFCVVYMKDATHAMNMTFCARCIEGSRFS